MALGMPSSRTSCQRAECVSSWQGTSASRRVTTSRFSTLSAASAPAPWSSAEAPLPGSSRRRHEEDLCQALGVSPRRKYEEVGGRRFDQCFAGVDEASVAPALDIRAPSRWRVLNLIVGKADGHAKTLSLLRGEAGAVR